MCLCDCCYLKKDDLVDLLLAGVKLKLTVEQITASPVLGTCHTCRHGYNTGHTNTAMGSIWKPGFSCHCHHGNI